LWNKFYSYSKYFINLNCLFVYLFIYLFLKKIKKKTCNYIVKILKYAFKKIFTFVRICKIKIELFDLVESESNLYLG
jgi:hypothetical protein